MIATLATGPSTPAPPGMGTRVFARSDGSQSAQPGPVASPSGSPSPSPGAFAASTPSPELAARARAEFLAWQSGTIDLSRYSSDAHAQFIPDAAAGRAQFSAAFVAARHARLQSLGTLVSFTQLRKTTTQGAQIYVYRAIGDKGLEDMAISWNEDGLVQYIAFLPPKTN